MIDSNIAICENSLAESLDCITKIRRALDLAIRISDRERIAKVKDAIIKLENNFEDYQSGLWGFAFESLVLDPRGKECIDEAETKQVIGNLEERLKRVGRDPWLAWKAVSLLAKYYAKKMEEDEKSLMRVLGVYENAFKSDQLSNSTLQCSNHLTMDRYSSCMKNTRTSLIKQKELGQEF